MIDQLTNQVLSVSRESLVLLEVVVEHLDISVESSVPCGALRKEAEDLHAAIGSAVQVPVVTSKVDGCDFVANWVNTSDASKPVKVRLSFEIPECVDFQSLTKS